MNRTFVTLSPQETQSLGQTLGRLIFTFLIDHANADDATATIALSGDLGAGKTTLTQGVAAGLGVHEQVTSPTFTLVNEYVVPIRAFERKPPITSNLRQIPVTFIHMDSYRLTGNATLDETAQDAATFGVDEFFEIPRSLIVIEWAERIKSLLPPDHLAIALSYGTLDDESTQNNTMSTTSRIIHITANGHQSQQLLCALAEQIAADG